MKLYEKYLKEIYPEENSETISKIAKIRFKGMNRIDIKHKETSDVIGFVHIQKTPEWHNEADYIISDAYLLPKHRHQGYMKTTITNYVKKNCGNYIVSMSDDNRKAYWFKIFSSLNYTAFPIVDDGVYVFKPV